MVLKDYEYSEQYEECAIIMEALTEYKDKYKSSLPKNLKFPSSVEEYEGVGHQKLLEKLDITVGKRLAQDRARIIKLNLPIKNEL